MPNLVAIGQTVSAYVMGPHKMCLTGTDTPQSGIYEFLLLMHGPMSYRLGDRR